MDNEAKTVQCNQIDGVSWLVLVCIIMTTFGNSTAKVKIIQNLFQLCMRACLINECSILMLTNNLLMWH